MKKKYFSLFFLIFPLYMSIAYAEYYSSSDAYLSGEDKKLFAYQGKKETVIYWEKGQVRFDETADLPEHLVFLKKSAAPAQIRMSVTAVARLIFGEKKFAKISSLEEKIRELQFQRNETEDITKIDTRIYRKRNDLQALTYELADLNNLPVLNYPFILAQPPERPFFLKINADILYIRPERNRFEGKNVFFGKRTEQNRIRYKVKAAYDNNLRKLSSYPRTILEIKKDRENRFLEFEIFGEYNFILYKVENEKLMIYEKEAGSRVLVPDFNFETETLYTTFVENRANSQLRLSVEYRMNGKKHNLIRIQMKSPISLFDTENKSSDTEENVGYLGDIKGKELMELKKVQLINGTIDTNWKNRAKSPVVTLDYRTVKGKDRKLWSKNPEQQYYGIEGLWYLVSWMHKYRLDKKKIVLLNGAMATDFTMIKRDNDMAGNRIFELTKEKNVVYRFSVDKKGFIQRFEFPGANQVVNLESFDTDTTIRNKKFLEEYKIQNHIVLIKEQ